MGIPKAIRKEPANEVVVFEKRVKRALPNENNSFIVILLKIKIKSKIFSIKFKFFRKINHLKNQIKLERKVRN